MTDKDLHWQDGHTPASRRYNDIYYAPDNGLLESRHVFLNGIDAPDIWQDASNFTLLENGFGTGLNFTMTCHAWLKTAPPHARMTYIATEKHPLEKQDMDRALSRWPSLAPEKQVLLAEYPPPTPGFHLHVLFGGRIKLLLLFGDSAHMLRQLEATVDGFYLDGFAPSRNPDMWSKETFSEIARLAAPHARLATFSAAGFVRRGLADVGFDMQKAPGFGQKRECLRGVYGGPVSPLSKPWFRRPEPLKKNSQIAIIGGGIAGLTAGLALQKSGYVVTIYEQEASPMAGASGNPAAILDPVLGQGPEGDFARAALSYALPYYRALDPDVFLVRGLTKFLTPNNPLYFPDCGAISPPHIKEVLRRQLTIKTRMDRGDINACEGADAVIICAGPNSHHFPETKHLPLTPVRGQITYLDATDCPGPPGKVLCGKGYLIPPLTIENRRTIITGASFTRHDTDVDIREKDHDENLENACILWPKATDLPISGGRSAIRAHSPDHLPLCGPIPDFNQYQAAYSLLKHGPKHKIFPPAPYHHNRYMITGLGSRGFITAPLLAEIMAALISGAPLAVSRQIYESLHPARFQIRQLIKG